MAKRSRAAEVRAVLASLRRQGSKRNRDGMARYGIVAKKVFGVSVGTLRTMGKRLGPDHDLAAALWATEWYEARMLASFVDDPADVTPGQMDRWARDFDNWAICDTVCFHLFDDTPYAWRKVEQWSGRRDEFVKRAAYALLASLSVHDKSADDELFLRGLRLIERDASDQRNFVKKAVNWALRSIGKRNPALNAAAVAVSRRLAASADAASRWAGKDAYRELTSPAVTRRLTRFSVRSNSAGDLRDYSTRSRQRPKSRQPAIRPRRRPQGSDGPRSRADTPSPAG
jgi:3-methyladenine DNA glycosylase AlkD